METLLIRENNENLSSIYNIFLNEYSKDEFLQQHRLYITQNNLGYGEDPFHVMWREIIKEMPNNYKFIEIGVYKGQILSLVKLLSNKLNKNCSILGVSPLNSKGDSYSKYDELNYRKIIEDLFYQFKIDFDFNRDFIQGDSTDEHIKQEIISRGFFDLVYIDGCHDYNCVVSDIRLMKLITKVGSYIVMDDSSCFKIFTEHNLYKGHYDVCKAVDDELSTDDSFSEIICVGHNRVFKKIK
jgi:hypothetical protein